PCACFWPYTTTWAPALLSCGRGGEKGRADSSSGRVGLEDREGRRVMATRSRKDMGGTLHIGKFQVLGELGSGAHSSILHIRRSADSKQYALKVVPIGGPDDLKYLEQAQYEFRVARMFDHPNLIRIYALETPRDWLFRVRKVHLLIEY